MLDLNNEASHYGTDTCPYCQGQVSGLQGLRSGEHSRAHLTGFDTRGSVIKKTPARKASEWINDAI